MKYNVKAKVASIFMAGAITATMAIPTFASTDTTCSFTPQQATQKAQTMVKVYADEFINNTLNKKQNVFAKIQDAIGDAFDGVTVNAATLTFNPNSNGTLDYAISTNTGNDYAGSNSTLSSVAKDFISSNAEEAKNTVQAVKDRVNGYQAQSKTNANYVKSQLDAVSSNLTSALKAPITGVQDFTTNDFAKDKEYVSPVKTLVDDLANQRFEVPQIKQKGYSAQYNTNKIGKSFSQNDMSRLRNLTLQDAFAGSQDLGSFQANLMDALGTTANYLDYKAGRPSTPIINTEENSYAWDVGAPKGLPSMTYKITRNVNQNDVLTSWENVFHSILSAATFGLIQ